MKNIFSALFVAVFIACVSGCTVSGSVGGGLFEYRYTGPVVPVVNNVVGSYAELYINGRRLEMWVDRRPVGPIRIYTGETKPVPVGWHVCGGSLYLEAKLFDAKTGEYLGNYIQSVYIPQRVYYYDSGGGYCRNDPQPFEIRSVKAPTAAPSHRK